MPQQPSWATPAENISGTGQKLLVDANNSLFVNLGSLAAYHAAVIGVAPVATPTDFLQIIGSATKTCRIKRIALNGVATANGNMPVTLVRRSTLGTKGTATVTAISPGQHDTRDAAPTMSIGYVQTANWTTVGTTAGLLGATRMNLGVTATGVVPQTEFNFSRAWDKPLYLRGTSDYLYVNLAGAAVPAGGLIDIEVEWEEF
jgi:hypothetical protein